MAEMTIQGIRVHYREVKGTGQGPQIVFIHGSGGNAGLWGKLMEKMARVNGSVAVDLPGHGESGGEGMRSIAAYREFLKEFVDALGLPQFVLAGHSMGGAIVQDFLLRCPAKVRAGLLIGTGARLRVHPGILEGLRKMATGESAPKFDPWGFSEKALPQVIAEGEREWAKTSPEVRYHDMVACDRFDLMGEVEKIHTPCLIVCGRDDRMTPLKFAEFLSRKIAGSTLEVIDGAGHMVMLEAPDALGAAVARFLSSPG